MLKRERKRKKQMAEINVVPYIDVMLVLLVIFMITAPLLTQGVNVNLPDADSKPVEQTNDEPVIVSVDKAGDFYINSGDNPDKPVSAQTMVNKVSAFLRANPGIPVYLNGDADVRYGRVVAAMALLQQAGVANVGMLTEPPETEN